MSEKTYYEQRLEKLGITEEINSINLWESDLNSHSNVLKPKPIFRRHAKGIEIMVYNLKRELITYKNDSSRYSKNYSIIRLENTIVKENGDVMKYELPKGAGTHPFFPPSLVDKYDKKKAIPVLFLTEGYFKAFKGAMHGIDIVGLSSITHMKDSATGTLHPEILELIETCKVRDVIWLTDGDCRDISTKEKDSKGNPVDLYRRPMNFFSSINTFSDLLKDSEVNRYFMHVDTDAILEKYPDVKRPDAKGLDDIMVALPACIPDIVTDIYTFSKPHFWFTSFNINISNHKVHKYFQLDSVTNFYHFHVERQEMPANREFIFNGTKYKYDGDKNECVVIVPGEASQYFRVGDEYYKKIKVPNKYKQLEDVFVARQKTTIMDDHAKKDKDFMRHIPKFEAFCNVPDNVNYQQVIHNCYNVYNQLDYKALDEECTIEDCATIISFLGHIFSHSPVTFYNPKKKEKETISMFELGLDYIQLLYQRPAEKLPIICMVSKENNTGKSTLGKLLKHILGGNCAVVGNQDLAGDFNKHWASKVLCICDEAKIDKQVVIEKVKALSTADKIMMNAKGRDHVEIDCFIKFMFITNNEDNFINIHEEDIRYWVIKVPPFREENPSMLEMMIDEIPAFMAYLSKRRMKTERLNRMWFHPDLLKTPALRKVIDASKSSAEKELRAYLRDTFLSFGEDTIMMTRGDINTEVFRGRQDRNFIDKIVRDSMKVGLYVKQEGEDAFGQPIMKGASTRYSYTKYEMSGIGESKREMRPITIAQNGRPYVFHRKDFLTPDEYNAEPGMVLPSEPAAAAEELITPKDDLPF